MTHNTILMKTRSVLKATFCFLALGLTLTGWLFAAELSTDFPKPPPPLDLAPRMGRPFNNHAVFQQNMPIPVWGWTLPGADVSVSFDQQKHAATAGADGRFEVKLKPMPADKLKSVNNAPAGHTLTVVTRAGGKE